MSTNFPSSLDSLTNPEAGSALNSPSHSDQHINSNDAIEALQAKVGANSSAVTTSHDYKIAQLESGKQDALGFTPEDVANKVTSISGSSTDTQYPSAKLVYDQLAGKQASGSYEVTTNKETSALDTSTTKYPCNNVVKSALDGKIGSVVEDTTPQLGGQLDVNGQALGDGTLEILKFSETASAVNEITVKNAATGNAPELQATGDDTNIDLNLVPKGTGGVKVNGVILKKTQSTASASSITPTGDASENESYVTALAANLTINAPSGTATNGNTLLIRIKDNGTARTLTWNAIYTFIGTTKPTTTTISKVLYIGAIYNSTSEKWEVTSINEE